MSTRRPGWAALQGFATVMMVVTVAVGVGGAAARLIGGELDRVVSIAAGTVVLFMFWRWIQIGARRRTDPVATATTTVPTPSTGPWGVVGAVLTVLVLGGIVALGVWSTVSVRGDRDRAETVRDEAVAAARRRHLDVDTVRSAQVTGIASAWNDEDPDSALQELLSLESGRIVDVSVDGETASLLIRPDGGGPPCAVVDIVHGDLIRGRITANC